MMRALDAVDAERIKLSTLRSPVWAAAAAALMSLGLAALQASVAGDHETVSVGAAVLGVAVFGVPVLMIVAAMTVTGEYRTGLIATTFLATPARVVVVCAKAVVAAVFSTLVAVCTVFGCVAVAGAGLTGAWAQAAGIGLYAALAAVLAVGVAVLVRHTAGAVTVLLLWPLLVEPLVGNLPARGSEIGPYLPFANMLRFLDVRWLFPDYAMPWGPSGSLAYFAAVVAAVFGAALVVVTRRDA